MPRDKRTYARRMKHGCTCIVCQGDIETTRNDTMFCSPACRQTACRIRRRGPVKAWHYRIAELIEALAPANRRMQYRR